MTDFPLGFQVLEDGRMIFKTKSPKPVLGDELFYSRFTVSDTDIKIRYLVAFEEINDDGSRTLFLDFIEWVS